MTDKIRVAKTIAKFAAGRGAGFVVSSAIKNLVPAANPLEKIQVGVGAYVLGSMAGVKAMHHVESEIDELVDAIKNLRQATEDTPDPVEE